MPDWSYRPLFKPWMLRCPGFSHAFVLRKMRLIGASALLYRIIDLMGHMRPPAAMRREVAGIRVASPLGMSAVIDPGGRAYRAFERFGYGFVEIGPVSVDGAARASVTTRREERALAGPCGAVAVDVALRELQKQTPRVGARRLVRVTSPAQRDEASGPLTAFATLAPYADGFLVDAALAAGAAGSGKPWGLIVRLADAAELRETHGAPLLVVDPDAPDTPAWTPADRERGRAAVTDLRRRFPDTAILYAAGGIECPRDALAFLDAGADLITLSHGFVFTGPGTPKRINEAIAARCEAPADAEPEPESPPDTLMATARYAWFWSAILGVAMTIGAMLAGFFALTRVILPYDEAATGLTREALAALNPRILHFMAHDRFTLAGTMLSLGFLYGGLAWHGVRRGREWAQEAIVFSAFAGFLTFFAFVAYGYFDQFHAFVAALMLPLAIQCAIGRPVTERRTRHGIDLTSDLDNDAAWRRACVGQLCFVVQATGLLLAGSVITSVGSAHVFVDSDLAFLGSTHDAIRQLHPNLVPLVAHDRATFGGMLLASGVAVLITALWGFRRGERWLWWTLAASGFPAYLATLWIHHDIQYTDMLHLSPVFIGLGLHILGLSLTHAFLARAPRAARTDARA
jgi:dihydroorotate dehydrogenase